jgi:hypothetical protein
MTESQALSSGTEISCQPSGVRQTLVLAFFWLEHDQSNLHFLKHGLYEAAALLPGFDGSMLSNTSSSRLWDPRSRVL